MKVVLVRFKDNERREFPLSDGITVLGRRTDSQLRIASQDVSRRHCQVSVTVRDVLVKDLGSSNGTFVNGKRIAEKKLAAGDRLAIGPVVFVVQIDGQPATIKPSDTKIKPAAQRPAAPAKEPAVGEEEVFELGEEDFDIDDAISSLDELDEEKDLP